MDKKKEINKKNNNKSFFMYFALGLLIFFGVQQYNSSVNAPESKSFTAFKNEITSGSVIEATIKEQSNMVEFKIANDENISGYNALKESWNLMRGKRLKLFLLELSFIGWAILSVLTLFIGFIFLAPYMQTSYAKFHDNLNESS